MKKTVLFVVMVLLSISVLAKETKSVTVKETKPAFTDGIKYGGQLSYATKNLNFGLGVRAEKPMDDIMEGLIVAPYFNIFFPDEITGGDLSAWQLGVNGLYNVVENENLTAYAGGGLSYDHYKFEVSGMYGYDFDDSSMSINVIGGAKFSSSNSMTPFVEGRLSLGGFGGIALTGGVLF